MNSDREEEYYQRRQLVESKRRVETDGMHTGSGHSFLNPTTNNLSDEEEVTKCDPNILTESGKYIKFAIISSCHVLIRTLNIQSNLLIISSFSLIQTQKCYIAI